MLENVVIWAAGGLVMAIAVLIFVYFDERHKKSQYFNYVPLFLYLASPLLPGFSRGFPLALQPFYPALAEGFR